MISSRRLRADTDGAFFDLIDEWRKAYPKRFLEWDALDGLTISPRSVAEHPEYVHIGIEEDGEPVAILLYRHSGNGWFETHLEAKRGFSFEKVHHIAFEWGWGLFELGAEAIYAWILDPNRVSARAVKAQGLIYDGTLRWQGIFRNKIVTSRRYTLYREVWESWQTNESFEDRSWANQNRQ